MLHAQAMVFLFSGVTYVMTFARLGAIESGSGMVTRKAPLHARGTRGQIDSAYSLRHKAWWSDGCGLQSLSCSLRSSCECLQPAEFVWSVSRAWRHNPSHVFTITTDLESIDQYLHNNTVPLLDTQKDMVVTAHLACIALLTSLPVATDWKPEEKGIF